PHVDAAVARLAFARVQLPADDGVNAVAADGDFSFHRGAIAKHEFDSGFVLLEADAVPAELQALLADPLLDGCQQHGLQVRAVNRELGPGVACVAAERLPIDE